MAVAEVVLNGFETLRTTKHILGRNREIILTGHYPKIVDNYTAYVDRAYLRLRIELTMGEENNFNVRELQEIFSDFFLLNIPKGRTEFCRYFSADHCYADFGYHCFDSKVGDALYERLKKELFTQA